MSDDIWEYRGHRLKKLEWGLWTALDEPDRYFFCYRPRGRDGPVVRRWAHTAGDITVEDLRQHVREVRARRQKRKMGMDVTTNPRDSADDYLASLRRRNRSEEYIRGVERSVEAFLAHARVDDVGAITPRALEAFLGDLAEDMSAQTVNKYRAHLSGWWAWAVRRGQLDSNPADRVEKAETDTPHRAFPRPHELLRIVRLTDSRYDRACWTFLWLSGLRRGSFVSIRPEHVSRDGIEVPTTKRREAFFIAPDAGCPLWGPWMVRLARYIWRTRQPTASYLRFHWEDARDAAGYDYTLHSLRHGFCSYLFLRGEHASDIAAWAHHSSPSTTEKWYAHLRPRGQSRLERNRARIDKLRRRSLELSGIDPGE